MHTPTHPHTQTRARDELNNALEATLLGTGELRHVRVSYGRHVTPRDVSAQKYDMPPRGRSEVCVR